MKILSDFDGVLTDLAEEAIRVRTIFEAEILAAAGDGAADAARLLDAAETAMTARPWHHGWRVKGRITAFANEDGFIRVNAAAAHLDAEADRGDADARRLRQSLAGRGLADFRAVAQTAYLRTVAETNEGRRHPLDDATVRTLTTLMERGHDVVVVSNSGTARIIELFRGAGLDAAPHGKDGPRRVRVRGDAKKFELGDASTITAVGDYAVDVDRPHYASILRDERPDIVIGDVFSLDLALPLHLACTQAPGFRDVHAIMRRRPYTPAWSAEHVARFVGPPGRASIIDRLEELSEVVRR